MRDLVALQQLVQDLAAERREHIPLALPEDEDQAPRRGGPHGRACAATPVERVGGLRVGEYFAAQGRGLVGAYAAVKAYDSV